MHIDGNKNIYCCSIAVIGKDKLNLNIHSRSLRIPLPLAIARYDNITSADVILHPHYPGIEEAGELRNTDRSTFLLPFESKDKIA